MTDLAPFRDPACTCRDLHLNALGESAGKEIAEDCVLHGRGTDYWNGMTRERGRILREMNERRREMPGQQLLFPPEEPEGTPEPDRDTLQEY